jgi:2-polyprenyl-6-methoxyphenol hydroxylase-like FAD-dependent oxidoreductase
LRFVEERYGEPMRALLRLDLVNLLTAVLPAGTVHYGEAGLPVAGEDGTGPAMVRVGDTVLESDLVVAADGIRSAFRAAMHPGHPGLRGTGSVSWRCVVPAGGLTLAAAETWGAGLRLSILPLPGDRVHFSALAKLTGPRRRTGTEGGPEPLFGRWHDPVPQLMRRMSAEELYFDAIEELVRPVDSFFAGRVVLVGDAAHAMTPNVGSANLALEDAVELAHAVADARSWPGLRAGFAAYDESRRSRTSRLSTLSRWMGRFAESSSPVAVAARDWGTWLGGFLPEVISRQSMDAMVEWSPPRSG